MQVVRQVQWLLGRERPCQLKGSGGSDGSGEHNRPSAPPAAASALAGPLPPPCPCHPCCCCSPLPPTPLPCPRPPTPHQVPPPLQLPQGAHTQLRVRHGSRLPGPQQGSCQGVGDGQQPVQGEGEGPIRQGQGVAAGCSCGCGASAASAPPPPAAGAPGKVPHVSVGGVVRCSIGGHQQQAGVKGQAAGLACAGGSSSCCSSRRVRGGVLRGCCCCCCLLGKGAGTAEQVGAEGLKGRQGCLVQEVGVKGGGGGDSSSSSRARG